MSLNKVLMLGNLTRDPELRYTGNSGNAVCKFGVALNRRYKRADGEAVEEVCFVDVTVWGRSGENCNQYLKKGNKVFIEGRLQFEQWQSQDGQKRTRLSVVAENVQFLSRPSAPGAGGGESGPEGSVTDFGESYGSARGGGAGGGGEGARSSGHSGRSAGSGAGSSGGAEGPDDFPSGSGESGPYHDDKVPF
ncbi:MAG: single-stranded DNA-binding protein [Planctomycetota bacterium]